MDTCKSILNELAFHNMNMRKGHLTARQRLFCEHFVGAGKHCAARAARLAGYAAGCSHVTGCQLLKQPKIAATVQALEAALARAMGITRQEVIKELVAATEVARTLGEPSAMISAWRQVALMAGFYTPEAMDAPVQAAELTPAQRALQAKFDAMPDAELLAFVAKV